LITGASGFVGANVALRMIARGHDVHAVVRPAHRTWRLRAISDAATLHEGDVCDAARLGAVFRTVRPDWVLHLAAYGAYASQARSDRCIGTNVEGTVNVVDAAAAQGVERLVNAGTSSEYGYKDHAPTEDEAAEPNSLYAVTKLAATAYAAHAGRSGRVHATTLRLYSVYGPYEEPTRLIPTAIASGLRGELPPLAAPDIARDFVYVDDVADAFEVALASDIPAGRVYNVGTGMQTTLRDVVGVSRACFGISDEPQWGSMTPRAWDTTVWVADASRARSELRWTASTRFEDGFRRTAAWVSSEAERRRFYETHRTPPG
jgi:dolichol-phosphate mannosyltransferase